MNDTPSRKIKTGSDPRTLADYASLRDELSKLTHPARPDVNWRYAEKLCLSLFEQNGVELQTAAWYTLARTQLAGLGGLNEGLSILDALIGHQWGTLWPQPVHARMEILSSLSQRVQQLMRVMPLNYSDLSQLYRTEQLLTRLGAVLERLELKHLSQFEALRTLMHNSAVRLENSEGADSDPTVQPGIVLPAAVISGTGVIPDASVSASMASSNGVTWVFVPQSEPQVEVDVLATMPIPVKKWKPFVAGMCTMLALGAMGLWLWQNIEPMPPGLVPVVANEASFTALEQLSPLWRQEYGFALAASAAPEEAEKLKALWQQSIRGNALPVEFLSGWHQGMDGLHALTQQLNALDERKGKYLTGSELKSMVFTITQNFGRTLPVEERLYQLSQTGTGEQLMPAQTLQTDIYLNQLLNRYALIKEQAAKAVVLSGE